MGLFVEQHVTNTMANMYFLQKSGDSCDLKLMTSVGAEVNVHRIVLKSCCAENFTRNISKDTLTLNIGDLSKEMLESIVHFMYTGEILINHDSLVNTVRAYRQFGLKTAVHKLTNTQADSNGLGDQAVPEIQDDALELKRKGKFGSSKRKPAAVRKKRSEVWDNVEPIEKRQRATSVKENSTEKDCNTAEESNSFTEKRQPDTSLRRSSRTCNSRYRKPSRRDGMKDETTSIAEVKQLTADDVSAKTKAEVSAGALLQSLETASTSEFGNVDPSTVQLDERKETGTEESKDCEVKSEKHPVPYKKRILRKHTNSQSDDKRIRCSRCDKTFDSKPELSEHRKQNSSCRRKLLACESCKVRCIGLKNKLIHMWKIHKVPLEDNGKYTVLSCKESSCCFKTLHQFEMKQHALTHTGNRPFCCEICGKTYKNKNVLKIHKQNQHEQRMSANVCPHCGKQLHSASSLHTHIQRIHEKRNRKCEQCDFTAYNKATIEEHMYKNHGTQYPEKVKVYKCEYCDYFTRWKNVYAIHIRRHTGVMPFECDICKKKFPAQSDLTAHKKWHNDKKHKCPIEACKFASPLPSKVRDHYKRMHEKQGEKPFGCHECKYRTNIRGNLILHLRKVHHLNVVTVENRVKTIRQDSIKVDDKTRIPYLPGLSLPKPEPAPAPSTDRSKDTDGPLPIVVSVPVPQEFTQLTQDNTAQETTNPVTMENSKTEQETSAIQQAMLQAGVIQSFETNQATEVSNDSAAEPMTPKVSRVNEGAHQEGNLKGKYGQECTENIQKLIQEVLNQEQVVSRIQPHMIKEQTPSVTAQSSHSGPQGNSVTKEEIFSKVIPESVLAASPENAMTLKTTRDVFQTSQIIPQSVLSLLQASPVSAESPEVVNTSGPPNTISRQLQPSSVPVETEKRALVQQLNPAPSAVQQEEQPSVVTIDTATLQLLQNNPGSSLVIPQRRTETAASLSPQPVANAMTSQSISRVLTTEQVIPGFGTSYVPTHLSERSNLSRQSVASSIPPIIEGVSAYDIKTKGETASLPACVPVAVSQRSDTVLDRPSISSLNQQMVQPPLTPLTHHLKAVPKTVSNILGQHSGLSVSKSPTLSSHGSMVSLLSGKHKKKLQVMSEQTAFLGQSIVQTLAQGSGKEHPVSRQSLDLDQQEMQNEVQQTNPLLHQSNTAQQQVSAMQPWVSGMQHDPLQQPQQQQQILQLQQPQDTISAERYMASSLQQPISTIVQPFDQYPTHASSSAIPTSVLALSESDDSQTSQLTTENDTSNLRQER